VTQHPETVKCLVWDLDNTLWTGTVLEETVCIDDGIRSVLETLDARGILHSIASKNDHEVAWERLVELGVAEYFLLPQISWHPKSDSVRHIAERLNFAHDAIAFVDDQPAERAEVAFHLPDVRCYTAEQIRDLPTLPEFQPKALTVDSRGRRQMYQANFKREAEREGFEGPDVEFLRSLDLRLCLQRAEPTELPRLEELTRRTSQMNATGIHYSEEALGELCNDPRHEVLLATLDDRFGSHGAIGVVLLEQRDAYWHVKLLATSCRVVSFGVGATILSWLITQAAESGVHLLADFRATKRNRIMEITYRFLGFATAECQCHASLSQSEDVQTLHLIPESRESPGTMRVTAPDLRIPLPYQRDSVRHRQHR
jgi:methoxymalonate biosynthesis protein